MFKVTVRYGIDSSTLESESPITFGAIRRDADLRAELGYGDNVTLLFNGVAMPDDAVAPHDATVVIETACNSKAN